MSTVLLNTYWAPMAAGRGGGNQISETPQRSDMAIASRTPTASSWQIVCRHLSPVLPTVQLAWQCCWPSAPNCATLKRPSRSAMRSSSGGQGGGGGGASSAAAERRALREEAAAEEAARKSAASLMLLLVELGGRATCPALRHAAAAYNSRLWRPFFGAEQKEDACAAWGVLSRAHARVAFRGSWADFRVP